jgi:FtsP/CotA-like multicopper oxidase with cupredoxin domain
MQSNAARAGLLAVLAAVAVVLFIVLSTDDDSDSDSTTETSAAVTTTATQPSGTTTSAAPPANAPTASIEVRDGEPVGGVEDIEVTKGDDVSLRVSSNTAGEVHVHGYEITKEVAAGGSVTVAFPADIDGKFEIELHLDGGEAQIAELTVQPS